MQYTGTDKERLGLYTGKNGKMMLRGAPFIGIGMNYYDLFTSIPLRDWDRSISLKALETLKSYDCKVIRFSTLPFYAEEFSAYEDERYWPAMDAIVKKAEELGIGLIPSLFWTYAVNDYCDEPYQSAFFDENSKTVRFTRAYIKQFVTRYAHSPAMYGWEFSNERVLGADFPDASHFRKPPVTCSRTARDENDRVTLEGLNRMYAIFAETVALYDPYDRIVSTGDTNPRNSSYHQFAFGNREDDTHEQHELVLDMINPQGITALSQHQYSFGEMINPGSSTYPLLDYFHDWKGFFSYLLAMASKKDISTYVGEVGYMNVLPETYYDVSVQDATIAFEEAVKAQRETGISLILFWNYDPTTVSLDERCVYDRGTGIEYSFSEKTPRGQRILEIMRRGNAAYQQV